MSTGLSVFSVSGDGFIEDIHEIPSRDDPVAARMASTSPGEAAAAYLMDSDNLYYEGGVGEGT